MKKPTQDHSQLTGLEFVRGLSKGLIEPPSMAKLLPFELDLPQEGSIEMTAIPEDGFLNTLGTVHGAWAMTMLDTSMGLAAHSTLKPREMAPSLETSVKFVRPIQVRNGQLRITGKVISRGRTIITLEGTITSADGKIYAHGTSTCMVVQL
ncbi:phenylacetic acid degradation protein [Agrobacterium tumefaciens]|nr:phenylacetic acid degradation protein [Agrobacterium tumefaciens]